MALTNATTLADYGAGIGTQGATLKVDATNKRVGVGTDSPAGPEGSLQVGTGITFFGNTGIVSAIGGKFSGDFTVGGTLTYEDVSNIDAVGIITAQSHVSIADSILHTGDTDTSIRFPAANTFTVETGGSERLRVNSSGLVGVNTDSPGRQLTVSGKDSEGVIQITNNTSGGTAGNGFELLHFTSGETQLLNRENAAMRFDTNNTERLRITAAGRVRHQNSGGETIHELRRTDSNTTGAVGTINFSASDSHSVASMGAVGDGDNEGAHIIFRTTSAAADNSPFNAATPERLRITSGGNIGINTTPGTLLELQGTSSKEADVTFNREPAQGTNDGVIGQLLFENHTDSVAQISVKRESAADDAYIQFATQVTGGGLTEKLRITSAGRFGLHTASPDAEVHIEPVGSNASIVLSNDGRTQWFRIQNNETDDALVFNANDSNERLRITSTGDVSIIDGNLVVANDHGVDFSATSNTGGMTSELFDDYEEGTFTPTASNFSTTGTVTLSGRYVKVGRAVTVGLRMASTGTIAHGTSAFISLPFAITNAGEDSGLIGMLLNNNSTSQTSGKSGVQCKLDGEGGSRFFPGSFTTTSNGEMLLFGGTYIAST